MRLPKYTSTVEFSVISKKLKRITKEKSLTQPLCYHLPSKGGRVKGQIICPRRGDLNKRIYRFIDFYRTIYPGEIGIVCQTIHDPNRTAPISLLCFPIGMLMYILTPAKTYPGELLVNMAPTPMNYGDSGSLANFASGVLLHNLSTRFQRSAGCSLILIRKDSDQALTKLKSGEMRLFHTSAIASSGIIGNENHFIQHYKRAGAVRRQGKRPRTRPCSMNPVDHPLGGRTRGGSQPMNKKGVITLNRRTVFDHHPHILYTRRQLKFVHH